MKPLALGACVLAFGLAFVQAPWGPPAALALGAAGALLLERGAVRRAWRRRVVLVAVVAAVLTGALVAWTATPARGVAAASAMLLRLLLLGLLAAVAARHVNAETVGGTIGRLGLRRLGLALGLALNALPHLVDAMRTSWVALAVRRQRSHPRLRDLPRLAELTLAHTARVAEEAAAAATLRGHTALVRPTRPLPAVPLVVGVTGRPGAGKTPALVATARALGELGVTVAGFVQIPVWGEIGKSGYLVRDLVTGEERTLATKVGETRGEHGTPFRFSPEGVAFARRALERARAGSVLVLDELGPVELRGGGHMPAVRRALGKPGLAAVLVTVRPVLIPSLLAQLALSSVVIVSVEGLADPPAALLDALAPALPLRRG